MSVENNGYTPELPWTIERQLKAYANAEGHTDRHEILYHSWRQNSRWFAQMLEYTLGSYLSYSQHNVTHCQAVIHNIECLLGEQEIRQLSATDCYAILMTVYMHDIGMCITEDDKKSIINSNEFVDWIDRQMRSSNLELMDHIDYLRCHNYNFEETDNQIQKRENYKKLYSQKLETSKSTNHLIAEHQRKNHANVAANRMKEWVTESGQLYSGLSLTGIPNRIHLMLAECARLHGVSKVEDLMQMLMDLPESDNGFAQDMYHPRFISVLLLIGDALDIDNGRFHPYARTMMGGTLGETSEIHYRKHKAIRALQITARKIYIRADCEKPSEMRMLRNDINWLQRFIMECSYQWSKIAPANYCGYLPMVDFEQISLGGKPIAEKLVRAQFHLSQQKAFKLLEGASLYDNRFVYLREMLQNAADAIKFQYWNDLDATEFHADPDVGLCEANNELPFRKYPIKIDFAIRKRRKDDPVELFSVTLDDLNMDEDERKNFEFGVEVSMQDCGVGIGEEDVNAISKVGTSQEHRHEIIQKMPPWLYPTGKFGIGLQSLFQADRLFKCVTRTHRDECYEMTFHSGTNNEGYINVIPRNWREGKNGSVPYGTKFTLFVPETHKESHTTNMSGWAGIDPYAADYIKSRSLRRSFELMKQMENQLDSWVGECIFPVVIREELLDISLRQAGWDKRLAPQRIPEMKKIMFKQVEAGNHKEQQRSEPESLLCWIFQKGDEKRKFLRGELPDKSAYYLDVDQCVLHIWSQKATCFFACSPKRIVQSINKDNGPSKNVESPEERGNKIKIFLKGLLINEIIYKEDELIEYIDIKNDLLQNYLYMSRNSFSPAGERMIKDEIIPQLRQTFREVLVHINETANQRIEENRKDLIKKITEHYEQIQREIKSDFNYSDPFFFRTRDFLEKKLNALNLFDFTLIPNDINWALTCDNHKNEDEKEQYARNLYIGKNNGCHNILDCIVDDLFQNLIYPGNADNLSRRMKSNIRNKVEKMQESDLDIFSFLLNHFAEKMEKINKWLYNKEFERDFSQMVKCAKEVRDSAILFAMFFFYMNQQYLPEQAGCTTSGLRQCGWEYVNKRIATALTKINKERVRLLYSLSVEDSRRQFYETFDSLIFIPVCNEDPKLYDTDDRCSISELMCKENHFAVFSTRFSKYDPWKHRLIRLRYLRNNYSENELLGSVENDVNDIPTILDVLKYQPRNKQECTSRWAFLDHWHKETIDTMKKEWSIFTDPLKRQNPTGRNSYRDLQDDRVWGNPMTRWIVRKLPSVSLGSDSNGNNRLNVLSSRSEAHVFFDARMIWLLLERTHSKYRTYHAQRFSTTVWDGLDNLACKDVSTYILTVNRGTIAEENKKSQMLLGFRSDLPDAIRIKLISAKDLLVDDSTFVQTGEKVIYSFFDLLDAIKESYSGVGLVPDFGMEQVHKLINEYHNIMQMRPFHRNQRDQDMEVVKILQEYCNAHPEIKPDRELMARDNRMLEQKVLSAYTSFLFDHSKVKKFSERIAYTDIKIPVDRHAFMCAVLMQLYGIKLHEIPIDLKEAIVRTLYGRDSFKELNVEQYSNENKLNKACTDIQIALAYCDRWAKLDFRNAFLEQICNWYWDNIWSNGSASTFLQYTKKYLLKDCSNQELEVLYKMQLRRIFCAAIIDCETAYF